GGLVRVDVARALLPAGVRAATPADRGRAAAPGGSQGTGDPADVQRATDRRGGDHAGPGRRPAHRRPRGGGRGASGDRGTRGGHVTDWGVLRRLLSRGGNLYAQLALGLPVADATSGYRVFRKRLLRSILEGGVHADGYGFQIELAYRAWRSGFVVGEVPITF